ncbi:hypothetical protein CRENBAI_008959, partial [Crenichthys baileyi]
MAAPRSKRHREIPRAPNPLTKHHITSQAKPRSQSPHSTKEGIPHPAPPQTNPPGTSNLWAHICPLQLELKRIMGRRIRYNPAWRDNPRETKRKGCSLEPGLFPTAHSWSNTSPKNIDHPPGNHNKLIRAIDKPTN